MKALYMLPELEALSLRSNTFSQAGIEALAGCLPSLPRLRPLILSF